MAASAGFQRIYSWNGQALCRLQQGRYIECTKILVRCLHELDRIILSEFALPQQSEDALDLLVMTVSTHPDFSSMPPVARAMFLSPPDIPSLPPTSPQVRMAREVQDENTFELFDQGLVTIYHDENRTSCPVFTRAFLWYNLALAVHQQALATEEQPQGIQGQSQLLHQALHYYHMSFLTILGNRNPDGRPDDTWLLLMALLNNMGHIHDHFRNGVQAWQCLEWQRILLARMAHQLQNPNFVWQSEYHFFAKNLVSSTCAGVSGSIFANAPSA